LRFGNTNISGIDADGVHAINGGVEDPNFDFGSELKWSGSLRGRIGYAAGQFMPFVTGGLAIGRYEISETPFSSYTKSKTYTGWTLGAGADYAVTNNILLRAEYRYTDYRKISRTSFPGPIARSTCRPAMFVSVLLTSSN
jgi:outer membrane immunogenic protein